MSVGKFLRISTRILAASVALYAAACDDSTGPDLPQLAGQWIYSSEVTFPDRECTSQGVLLTLEQDDDTFSGTVEEGTFTCTSGESGATSFFEVSSGTIMESVIEFNMGGDDTQHSGTLQAGRIEGSELTAMDRFVIHTLCRPEIQIRMNSTEVDSVLRSLDLDMEKFREPEL